MNAFFKLISNLFNIGIKPETGDFREKIQSWRIFFCHSYNGCYR